MQFYRIGALEMSLLASNAPKKRFFVMVITSLDNGRASMHNR